MRSRALYLLAAMLIVPLAVWLAGCTDFDGEITANQPPEVEFVNVHADIDTVKVDAAGDTLIQIPLIYDFAPVIYWKGSDSDGFIEYYSFADIIDAAAISDPISYIPRIPQESWVDTIATRATIKLLSEIDDTTEHVFYLRAFDNGGAESAVKYRRFFRSNNPPVIPRIGRTGADEADFANRYVVADTLFSAPNLTNIYQGIQFSWRGSDPDDKALFTIPLEFQAILVKSPAETIFVNPWTDEVEVQLIDLETGFYTLNVWARDDGLTKSVAPARAEFNVIRPTFANNLLIVLESPFNTYDPPTLTPPTREKVRDFYEELLDEVAPRITNADLDPSDSVDVRFYSVHSNNQAVPRSLISQYKLVIYAADHASPVEQWSLYTDLKQPVEEDYLRVGGRVWQMGRCLTFTGAYLSNDNATLLSTFFGIDGLAEPTPSGEGQNASTWWWSFPPSMFAEFVGTRSGLPEFPALTLD
ncbi:MAG TPA: hypothetical protein ENH10_06300, partial [Bacteroidetes bacterium]|nr:hypothetical protein [Bacteroidota bacterium]HEX04753.1 hypothetical protein [Bacteroidota bacterium]